MRHGSVTGPTVVGASAVSRGLELGFWGGGEVLWWRLEMRGDAAMLQ